MPVITGVTTIVPFLSTVTVEPVPRELIAALSTVTRPRGLGGRRSSRVADIPARSWLLPCVSTSVTS